MRFSKRRKELLALNKLIVKIWIITMGNIVMPFVDQLRRCRTPCQYSLLKNSCRAFGESRSSFVKCAVLLLVFPAAVGCGNKHMSAKELIARELLGNKTIACYEGSEKGIDSLFILTPWPGGTTEEIDVAPLERATAAVFCVAGDDLNDAVRRLNCDLSRRRSAAPVSLR
jgi:hypothetical protein